MAHRKLIKDRYPEFVQLCQSKATNRGEPTDTGKRKPKNNFMQEFFKSISQIQHMLNEGRSNVDEMTLLLDEALNSTTSEAEKRISARLATLVQDTNRKVTGAKNGLQILVEKSEEAHKTHPSPAQDQIRRNMQQAMGKKLQQLLVDFQKAQGNFKEALERRQQREIMMLVPEATAAEVSRMIEDGETSSLLVAQKMNGTHCMLIEELDRIKDKHQDILRLERSMADLLQMFNEMAVLVESQGDMIDNIQMHVQNTVKYTAKAEKELVTARKYQKSNMKWMCCLTMGALVLVMVILAPILITNM